MPQDTTTPWPPALAFDGEKQPGVPVRSTITFGPCRGAGLASSAFLVLIVPAPPLKLLYGEVAQSFEMRKFNYSLCRTIGERK